MNAVDQSPSLRHTTRPQSAFSFFRQIRLGFALTGVLLLAASSAWAHPNNAVSPATANMAQAEQLTHRLVGLSRALEKAPSSDQAERLQTLLMVADERQQLLLDMVQENPGEVLRVALPDKVRTIIPEAVQDRLELNAEQTGTVEVICLHDEQGSPTKYFLQTASERLGLHFKNNPPDMLTGQKVKVSGLTVKGKRQSTLGETDGAMAIESGNQDVLILAAGGGEEVAQGTAGSSSAPLPNTFGEQKTLVLLAQYHDDTNPIPQTREEVHDLMFGTVSNFFMENSFQQTWLSGDTYGWYTIPVSKDVCNFYNAGLAADQAATSDGIDINAYDRIVYFFATASACNTAGMGTVEGSPSRSYLDGTYRLEIIAHEMGHNFGLYHSNALDCHGQTLGDSCTEIQYQDTVDTMGGDEAGHYNAIQKERLGWLNFGQSPSIQEVSDGGVYVIAPYETQIADTKSIKLFKGYDSRSGNSLWYYLQFRQALGLDEFLSDRSYRLYRGDVTDGIEVHLKKEGMQSPLLLHMKPESEYSNVFGFPDWRDPILHNGATFVDTREGISIRVNTVTPNQTEVQIQSVPPTCTRTAPMLSLDPSTSQWVTAGSTVSYQITVTNTDNTECGLTGFLLTTSEPGGWTTSLQPSSATLNPGESTTVELFVTSPASAYEGFYEITVTGINQAAPSKERLTVATYVVSADGGNSPPSVSNDMASVTPGNSVTVNVLGNDSDPDGDLLDIVNTTQGNQGDIAINSDATLTYFANTNAKRNDQFNYTVTDGEYEVTGTVTIKISKEPSGGSGGKGGGKPQK